MCAPDSTSLAELRERLAPPPVRQGDGDADDAGGEVEDDEEEEQGVALGLLMSILSPSPAHADEARSAERRAYSMEHFRWGKPTGRKRRPVKVYAAGGGGGEKDKERELEDEKKRK